MAALGSCLKCGGWLILDREDNSFFCMICGFRQTRAPAEDEKKGNRAGGRVTDPVTIGRERDLKRDLGELPPKKGQRRPKKRTERYLLKEWRQ